MKWEKARQVIQKHKSFIITTHLNPDPDAICSELAIFMSLSKMGKKVTVINDEDLPERFDFLPHAKIIKGYRPHMKVEGEVWIVLDCGDLSRIGKTERLLKKNTPIINIDHHVTNDAFGAVNIIDYDASSTAQMIYEFIQKLKIPLTREIALCLYAGILADTGSFVYDNTTAKTHAVVAKLMKFDFSAYEIYRQLYEQVPLQDLRLFNKIISNFEVLFGDKVIIVYLKKKVFNQFSVFFDLRDKIFKTLRSIKGSEIYIIFTEETKNLTRINFRSSGKVNVAKLARHFKGGGHKKASGCLVPKGFEETKKIVLNEIETILAKH